MDLYSTISNANYTHIIRLSELLFFVRCYYISIDFSVCKGHARLFSLEIQNA